ncbi:MAG: diguanylate cyclase [Myxococcales bacterium]|nr:diguanylate cyclase [Myxococcales bacterium]MDD9968994.1 diguanylate cyclase [Myxococcales bacterium]
MTKFDPAEDEGQDLQAILTVLSGSEAGTVHRLDRSEHVIGRDDSADIILGDAGLSRRHASVNRTVHGTFLRDLGSTNGTFVNAEAVRHAHELADGDRIQMGQGTVLRFSLQDRLEQEAAERLYEMTVRDPLTRLYNRRYLDERLRSEFAYAKRHEHDLCVLMVDVDHFKFINDTHGHAAGDEVLRHVARGLEKIVRAEDLVARYGGEEFIILARGIDPNGGLAFAERIRVYLGGLAIAYMSGTLSITVSVGVAHTDGSAFRQASAVVAAADAALYRAKANGRNRVELADETTQIPSMRPGPRVSTLSEGTLDMGSGTSAVRRRPPSRAATQPLVVPPRFEDDDA